MIVFGVVSSSSTSGMTNLRAALESFTAREICQTFTKKFIFVSIEYSGMPEQRGTRIINNVIATKVKSK